jgi:hypothetical protein
VQTFKADTVGQDGVALLTHFDLRGVKELKELRAGVVLVVEGVVEGRKSSVIDGWGELLLGPTALIDGGPPVTSRMAVLPEALEVTGLNGGPMLQTTSTFLQSLPRLSTYLTHG